MIQATALQCVVHLARPIGGNNYNRRDQRLNCPQLWHSDLKIRQHLQEEGFKLFIGTVEFVDQEDGRDAIFGFERLQERTFEQELGTKEFTPRRVYLHLASRLQQTNLEHLLGIVPLVNSGTDI